MKGLAGIPSRSGVRPGSRRILRTEERLVPSVAEKAIPQNTIAMARSQGQHGDGDGDGKVEFRPSEEPVEEEENGKKEEDEQEDEDEDEEEQEEEEEGEQEITEYEKQRLRTIERNKAMLASLQLPSLASSLAQASKANKPETARKSKGAGPRRRSERLKSVSGKRSVADDGSSSSENSDSESESLSPNKRKRKDQEYEPPDEDHSASESEEEMDEHEKEALQDEDSPGVDMDDEERALQQALALSMGASLEGTDTPGPSKSNKRRSSAKKRAAESGDELEELQDTPKSKPSKSKANRKTQKMSNKRHFTKEEVDGLFPFFDENGRGRLTLRDLERVSTAHDFTWNAQELLDMIHLFNHSHTGVLDLADFRHVANRCNLVVSER